MIGALLCFDLLFIVFAWIMFLAVFRIWKCLALQKQFKRHHSIVVLHLIFFFTFIFLYFSSIVILFEQDLKQQRYLKMLQVSSSLTQLSNTFNIAFILWLTNRFTKLPDKKLTIEQEESSRRSSASSVMSFEQQNQNDLHLMMF